LKKKEIVRVNLKKTRQTTRAMGKFKPQLEKNQVEIDFSNPNTPSIRISKGKKLDPKKKKSAASKKNMDRSTLGGENTEHDDEGKLTVVCAVFQNRKEKERGGGASKLKRGKETTEFK